MFLVLKKNGINELLVIDSRDNNIWQYDVIDIEEKGI